MVVVFRLKADVDQYYRLNGIHPAEFRCEHLTQCKGGADGFIESTMPTIGERFGLDDMPRIVVLSLDPVVEINTVAAREIGIRAPSNDYLKWPKHKHWYLTHEFLLHVLRPLKPALKFGEVTGYFANVNSAKCRRDAGTAMGRDILFQNCRSFIPGEVTLFDPDILVTQGDKAMDAVKHAFHIETQKRCCEGAKAKNQIAIIGLPAGKRTLWLHTYHPTSYGHFHNNREHYRNCYPRAVSSFIQKHD